MYRKTVEELQKDQREKLVIDIRSEQDYIKETYPGAKHIFWEEFMEHIGEIPKELPVYLFCYTGQRSDEIAEDLSEQGYEIYSIEGGYRSYLRKKLADFMKEDDGTAERLADKAADAERSIIKKFKKTVWRPFTKAINAYEMSEDPTIRRQSLSPYYLEYAETFYPGDDSLRFYVQQAWSCAKVPLDSVRCWQKFAKLAALDGDRTLYKQWRDLCLDPSRSRAVSKLVPALFAAVDTLFAGLPLDCRALSWKLPSAQLFWVAKIAENLGRHDVSEKLKDQCIIAKDKDFGQVYDMNIAEISARFSNDVLSADLAAKTSHAQKVSWILVALLAGLIVTAAVVGGIRRAKRRTIA